MKSVSKIISLIFSITLMVGSFAQTITTANTQTPNQLVQNVLLGFGVTASNITINGSPVLGNTIQSNVSYFTSGTTTFPIQQGVLLTTGEGIGAIGPNSSGSQTNPGTPMVSTDVDLNLIASGSVTNGVVLEFDFVPSGDTVAFNYMFGSDEYPEFSPSSFNDAFGFFLTGPNPSGPAYVSTNIALVPGTSTPVTINNVGPGAGQNPSFYTNNLGGAAYGNAIQYDGTTVVLSANASLICGATYHIKLAICNVGDQAYDSGVFLQANSFSSEAIEIAVATVSGDTSVYEGCSQANLMFIRPQTQLGDTLIISYTIGGTATMGTDYGNLANPITFLPGVDTIVLSIIPTFDGMNNDNFEYVTITAMTISSCGDTIISSGTLYILDSIPIDITESNPTVLCFSDSVLVTASATGLFPPFTYNWQGGQTGSSAYFPSIQGALTGAVDYIVTATNSCGYSNTDTVTITLNQTLGIDSIIMLTPATCEPVGSITTMNYPYGGTQGTPGNPNSYSFFFDWTYQSDTNAVWPHQSSLQDLPGGWYVLELTDNIINCTVTDSVFVETINTPSAQGSVSPSSGCSPLVVTFSNSSINAIAYTWDFGNGNVINTTSTSNTTQTYTQDAAIMLVASNGYAPCNDTTYMNIQIVICGCMNPEALNYNPAAIVSDGSCVFPVPTVTAPNVITLNGDDVNGFFFLNTTNAVNIEITIVNRWGTVIYQGVGNQTTPPMWDGRDRAGNTVGDGVYFHKYIVTGMIGEKLEGHGFVTVVR